MTEFDWIADDESLADVVTSMAEADRYAVDTEFHRERTYFPRVALVQLAWDDQIAVVDPLAVEPPAAGEGARGPRHRGDARRRPGPRGPRARLRHLPDDALRHAAGRRVRGLRHAVAGRPGRAGGRRAPAQGRPPHRLAAPAARRRPAPLRGVRRRPPLRDPGPPDRRPRGQRPARVGARRVRAAPHRAAARCGRPRTRGCASRRPGTSAARPPASPVRSRRGASGGPPRSTSRSASSSPTSASSGSRSGPRSHATSCGRSGASTTAT